MAEIREEKKSFKPSQKKLVIPSRRSAELRRKRPKKSSEHTKALLSEEAWDGWGFADTRFEWISDREIKLTGNRYPLCQDKLGQIVPWFEKVVGLPLERTRRKVGHERPLPPSPSLFVVDPDVGNDLRRLFKPGQISFTDADRVRHGHGQFHGEIYKIRYGSGLARVPDGVVWPTSEKQVMDLVTLAQSRGWVIVPFGGGTNVTEALLCPSGEKRPIVAVDMRRMCQLLWVDPQNQLASIEAGAVGRDLEAALAAHGFTLGHEPDSLEFSTLGGWIATHASGMKKNRYGNIEDLVIDLTMATAQGLISRTTPSPRESTGIDLRKLAFGSEGALGIITRAVVKITPLPELTRYGSYVFPTMEDGVRFAYDLVRGGSIPASVRLVDPIQFQFGQTLRGSPSSFQRLKSTFEKYYVTLLKRFDPAKMIACTLVHEGSRDEVRREERYVHKIASRYHGIPGGAGHGSRGYQLTFSIAYLRDFIMAHDVIADSFETSVSWGHVMSLCHNVVQDIREKHKALGLPGRPFVTYRITQLYRSGVCVYFYLGVPVGGVKDPLGAFSQVEETARKTILRCGGSLSHHHGVGQHRKDFLPEIQSSASLMIKEQVKKAFDPSHTFGVGNQGLISPSCS